jgi:enoyl-CoA hydratase
MSSENTEEPDLLVEADGPVRIVTINRPHAGNALSEALHRRFVDVWQEISQDPEARVVVLTGSGRTFCAGGDFTLIEATATDSSLESRARTLAEAHELVTTMLRFPLPIVAAVNGPAIGLGASIASLCDIVYLADRAFLSDPHLLLGLVPGDGAGVTWPLLMNVMRAKEYLFTGARIPAEEAERLGLANKVLPSDELLPYAMGIAHQIGQLPGYATQTTKRVINTNLDRAITEALDFALTAELVTFYTPEHQEAVTSFKENLKSRSEPGK